MVERVRLLREGDSGEWLRLRRALWPDCAPGEHEREMAAIRGDLDHQPVFVAERGDGRLGGFVEVALHATAEGCRTGPVGYLEGWYVDPDLRRQGIGRRLVAAAEAWARRMGCREMASDTSLEYPVSPRAHARLGYQETRMPLHYRKALAPEQEAPPPG